MSNLIRKSVISFGTLAVALVFIVAAVIISVSSITKADDGKPTENGRLISIYDRGVEKIIITQSGTIGDALKEANIVVDAKDLVEPAVDQKLIASDYQVNIYRARPVIVIDGNVRTKIITAYQTAAQIAEVAGIKLFDEDTVNLEQTDNVIADGAGLKLIINRSVPIQFTLYGKLLNSRTLGRTVGEMLTEKGIKLADNDRVLPDVNTKITDGIAVRVWREGKQIINVDEPINFDISTIEDGDQLVGYKAIKIAGVLGERNVSYEITIQDGVEVGRLEINGIITKQSQSQVEVIGIYLPLSKGYSAERVSVMTAAGISESDQGYAAFIIDNENGSWCPTRWQGQSGCPAVYQEKFPGAENSNQVGYGLCQATPGNKMASAGTDWRTNPVTQMKWCASYAISRYVTWKAAYDFKVRVGWW